MPVLDWVRVPPRSPVSSLMCSPPTPCPLRPRLRFPLRWPTSMRALLLCHMGRRHVRPQRAVRRRPITGSPQSRSVSRRDEGRPGFWTVLFVRAVVEHPAGYVPLLAHSRRDHCCLRSISALSASGKTRGFGAAVPRPARSHAYASHIPSLGSAQGLLPARAGSPFAGRVSHSLDDARSFMVASQPPIPSDQPCLVALKNLSVPTEFIDRPLLMAISTCPILW